jgi:Zn-finger nucleic acid-binding protein
MNCNKCGAPINLSIEKVYIKCDHCGNYSFLEDNIDGIILSENESNYTCPICKIFFVQAIVNNIIILSCKKCQGNLIDQSKLLEIIRCHRTSLFEKPINKTIQEDNELMRKINCPKCNKVMNSYPYSGASGNIIIQGCNECKIIWLDFGELSKIIISYIKNCESVMNDNEKDRQFFDEISVLIGTNMSR